MALGVKLSRTQPAGAVPEVAAFEVAPETGENAENMATPSAPGCDGVIEGVLGRVLATMCIACVPIGVAEVLLQFSTRMPLLVEACDHDHMYCVGSPGAATL